MSRPRRVNNDVIYKAAHDIIMRHGPRGLTFQSLGDATGLVPAALVRRFKTKQQLLLEADMYWLEAATDALAEAASRHGSPLEAIIDALSSEMNFATSADIYINGLAFLLEGLASSKMYTNYQTEFKRHQKDIEYLLEAAKKQGELRSDVNSSELSRLLQITQQGACHMWVMTQAEPIGSCIERYLHLALRPYIAGGYSV